MSAEFARAATYLDEFVRREERIGELDAQLERCLTEAAAANRLTKTLETFSTILSVTTLATQVSAALREMPSNKIDYAPNAQELVKRVKEHERVMQGAAARYEQERKPVIDAQRRSRPLLIKKLEDLDLPSNYRRHILH